VNGLSSLQSRRREISIRVRRCAPEIRLWGEGGGRPIRHRVWGLGSESDDSVFGVVELQSVPVLASSGVPVAVGQVAANGFDRMGSSNNLAERR
jgi:hypothetical protein